MCLKDVGKRRPRRLDKNVSDTSPSEVSILNTSDPAQDTMKALCTRNQAMILFEKQPGTSEVNLLWLN